MYLAAVAVVLLSRHGVIQLNGAALYVPVSILLLLALLDWLWIALQSSVPQTHLFVTGSYRTET